MAVEHERDALISPVTARDHRQGSDSAVLTLVEYADYECPYSGRAYPIVKELQQLMGSRLRFVFRNFPLREIHPHAQHAAEAAEAAARQGLFWAMHDMLFEHQSALDDSHLMLYAKNIGADGDQFHSELTAHVHAPRVLEDIASGVHSGVRGTPTFFINGVRHDDAWDLETLMTAFKASSEAARLRVAARSRT